MRTTHSTSGTTGKTRRAPVATTLAALCLALPMSGLFGGTAFATNDKGAAAADNGSSSAPGQAKKTDTATPAPAPAPAPAPYTNQGGVTTGSNTTKYETVSDHKGSTYTGVGGGQPSGDIHSPQPYSNADKNNTGANDTSSSNQYKSTRDGSPSLNGNGGGKQVGQPCAGCVGKADNKNPPGQAPNGTDHNAGYECDRNHGIGRSNPAHTGCTSGGTTGGSTGGTTTGGSTGGSSTGGSTTGGSTGGGSTGGGDCEHGHNGGGMGGHDCGTTGGTTGGSTGGTTTGGGSTGGSTGGSSTGGGSTTGGSTGGGSTGGDHGNKNDKVTICHATGSATNPFVIITPNKNGVVHGHAKHADDIIPPFTYNDHGVTKSFPGLNWNAAGQAAFANGCHVPTPPKTCPNGTPMPASGTCGGGGGGGVTCPNGSPMPASGNIADCNPPVVCQAGTTMNGNGTCTPPVVCQAGTTMNGNGTCSPPVVCPEGTTMVGPIVPGATRPGCTVTVPVSGGNGGQAQNPPPATTPTPTVIGQGTNPQPATIPVAAPAGGPTVTAATPAGLPFTGANAALLVQLAVLMLLVGGGLAVMTRKPKPVRAAV